MEAGVLRYNNSAGRLLMFLDVAKRQNENIQTHMVWRKVLGLDNAQPPKNDLTEEMTAKIYKKIVILSELLWETEQAIQISHPNDSEPYLRHFPSLAKVVCPPNLTIQWSHYRIHLTDHALYGLEFCAKDISLEKQVPNDVLNDLRQMVSELFDTVRDSDLQKYYRDWLLEMIANLRRSLDLYEFKGAKELKKCLVQIVGDLTLHYQATAEVKKAPFWQRIKDVIDKLASAAKQAEEYEALAHYTVLATIEVIEKLPYQLPHM